MRLISLLLISCSLALPAFAATTAEKSHDMTAFWQQSGLGLSDLKVWVNDEACGSSRETFLGCISAVNTLLAAAHPKQQLIPEAGPNHKSYSIAPLLKPLSLGDAQAELEKTKLERARVRAAWLAIYDQHPEISFSGLTRQALAGTATEAQLLASAINAYLSVAKDPHTYIVPRDYQNTPDPGEFSGIGVDLQIVQGLLAVLKPKEASPALAAGIRTNDIIDTVEGVEMAGLTLDEAIKYIRGPVGTLVRLKIRRRQQVLNLEIVRQKIINPNVSFKTLNDQTAQLGYIRLNTFDDANSCAAVRNAIAELSSRDVKGLVFDLRDNLGGLVDQAVCIASLFVGPYKEVAYLYSKDVLTVMMGMEMWTHYADYQFFPQYSADPIATTLPLAVLINGYSASASEILAGALQDFKRAIIIGDRSYGKGTFQQGQELPGNSNVTLMATGGRFYLPSKRTNQIVGIQPDLFAYRNPQPTAEDKFALREEDLYLNALPPQGPPYVPTNLDEIGALKSCIDADKHAEHLFEAHRAEPIAPEFQILYAEDALSCVLRHP